MAPGSARAVTVTLFYHSLLASRNMDLKLKGLIACYRMLTSA